eukprot:RCo010864
MDPLAVCLVAILLLLGRGEDVPVVQNGGVPLSGLHAELGENGVVEPLCGRQPHHLHQHLRQRGVVRGAGLGDGHMGLQGPPPHGLGRHLGQDSGQASVPAKPGEHPLLDVIADIVLLTVRHEVQGVPRAKLRGRVLHSEDVAMQQWHLGIAEQPGVEHQGLSHHHPVRLRDLQAPHHVGVVQDVAVGQYRDPHGLLHRSDGLPVGCAMVRGQLLWGAAMHRQHHYPALLQHLREGNRLAQVRKHPDLRRHREWAFPAHPPEHRADLLRALQQARPIPRLTGRAQSAAQVKVHCNCAARRRGDERRGGQKLVRTVRPKLHNQRVVLSAFLKHLGAALGIREEPPRGFHWGVRQLRAIPPAQQPEGEL